MPLETIVPQLNEFWYWFIVETVGLTVVKAVTAALGDNVSKERVAEIAEETAVFIAAVLRWHYRELDAERFSKEVKITALLYKEPD